MFQLKAAGGVVIRNLSKKSEILLIKRNGVWDLPKGKLESNESVEECAVREVEEETGAKSLEIDRFLCKTYHHYTDSGERIEKITDWYLMRGNQVSAFEHLKPQNNEGITDLEWVDPLVALEKVHYENLTIVIENVLDALAIDQNKKRCDSE
ncbi:MAG: NUDIX hydrolase [Balneolaceae bacterium]